MPQTNKKQEWVQHYKKQLKVFFPKNSGWYISNNGGNIKIEVKSSGRKETKTLPYAWNEQEMAVAIEEIKLIYKRYVEGKELWSMYQKSKGGNKGEKTKPRRLEPLLLVNTEGKAMDYNLQTKVEFGEALPSLGT